MNVSKHSKIDLVCHGNPVAQTPKIRSDSSTGASRRRLTPFAVPRPGLSKPVIKSAVPEENTECISYGRSSDPMFKDTACKCTVNASDTQDTPTTNVDNCGTLIETVSQKIDKLLDDGLKQGLLCRPTPFTEYHHRATTERIFEATRYPWNGNDTDDVTDPQGGGEGKTDVNDDDDDAYEEEEEEGSPPAMRYVRNKADTMTTLQRAREVKRAEHRGTMETIARSVAPAELEEHLKGKGFLSYNYNNHARTMSKQNLKAGKKKAKERLVQLLTFA